jgi:hypothetical protein
MRKLNLIGIIGTALLSLSNISFAQDTLAVNPGLGTLNAAILANGDTKIYKLEAGKWYGLDAIVEAGPELSGLQIVGEKTTGLPAVIQVGNAQDGSVFPSLFNLFTNLTLKNVFLADQDFSGTIGTTVMNFNAAVKVVIDNCVIDPAGINYTFGGGATGDHSKLYLTNTQIIRNGYISSPNDGGWIQGQQFDTLWVENNTFVSSGQDFLARGFHSQPPNTFIWINHNTILWHDVWIKKSYNDPNFFFTNNLMVDPSIYAQLYTWGQFFPDYKLGNTMLSLTCVDTMQVVNPTDSSLMNETLPSTRTMFWQRNLQYDSPQLKSLVSNAKSKYNQDIYLIPMLWDENTPADYAGIPVVSPADSSRENRILNDHVNWPNMKYNHNMYDINPQWVDARITNMEDSVGTFINGWFQGNIFEPGSVDLNALPGYNWDIDSWNGVSPAEYPQTWPRFNGAYTNSELLTASTEGLPLGDLNWFADKKAKWEAEKDAIQAHILALNEEQYAMPTGIKPVTNESIFGAFPNPGDNVVTIKSSIELKSVRFFDVTGKLVKTIEMQNSFTKNIEIADFNKGVYILKAESASGENYTSKFVKK